MRTILLVLCLACAARAQQPAATSGARQPTAAQMAQQPAAALTAQQPTFAVSKTGHGPALILIPGLDCSGEVWSETADRYKDRFTCYSLTLPGFAGVAPHYSDSILSSLSTEIAAWIARQGIRKPILIGHSLGGWLALKIEADHPGISGGIVCVSSAPFLPALSMGDDISMDSARATGAMIKRYMSAMKPSRANERPTLAFMIRDSVRIEQVVDMALHSDPPTQAEVMYELFSTDLRPDMAKVRCPILVLGDWSSYKSYGATRDNTLEKYQHQFSKAPQVTIVLNDASRHFIMYDEPSWFFAQVDPFLGSLTALK